jgi:hypothetical protein
MSVSELQVKVDNNIILLFTLELIYVQMNKPIIFIKKGRFHKKLADSIPELAIDLINIIYLYAINENDHAEYYHSTIDCSYQLLYGMDEITILGNNLYIKEYQYGKIIVYDLKTFKLVDTIYHINNDDNFREHIKKYLCENKNSICSGYYPYMRHDLIKNFWSRRSENIVTCNDKYMFTCNNEYTYIRDDNYTCVPKRQPMIHVYNRITNTKVIVIYEKYSPIQTYMIRETNYNGKINWIYVDVYKYCSEKNITVYNNILYVIGYYMYDCIDNMGGSHSFSDNYIHLYNANTFEFIREFTKIARYNPSDHPIHMAVTDDNIIIGLSNNQFEIWVKEDCL